MSVNVTKRVRWDPMVIMPRGGGFDLMSTIGKMSRVFYRHGKFCASHPWEVMVTFLTLTICVFSMGPSILFSSLLSPSSSSSQKCLRPETSSWNSDSTQQCLFEKSELQSTEVVILIISRCMALLYVYHQFRNLYKLGSKYLVGISGLFTVFSSFVFCSGVVNFLNGNLSELNKALPFFFLLSDLSKASLLAQFALSSFTREEVRENIARGMAILGPSLTLDTMVETLAIGVGTLSGVTKLEEISGFACMSVFVNYVVFMTFFPACLSLALELSHNRDGVTPVWQLSSLTKVLQLESEQTPNPVIQRVKVIMSAGLMLVHTLSRWPNLNEEPINLDGNLSETASIVSAIPESLHTLSRREPNIIELLFRRLFAVGSEQVVMLGLVCALAIKYIFFENKDNYNDHFITSTVHQQQSQETIDASECKENDCEGTNHSDTNGKLTPNILVTFQDSDTESAILGYAKSNGPSVSGQTSPSRASSTKEENSDAGSKSPTFYLGDDDSDDFSLAEFTDREVQTEDFSTIDITVNNDNAEPRDLQTLISILNSGETKQFSDTEVQYLVEKKYISSYKLESTLENAERGVSIRRKMISKDASKSGVLNDVPYMNYDYSLVLGACCENVIGYLPIPLGIAGPLLLNGKKYHVPMATTEGCLVASTNRGCRALLLSGGVQSCVFADGMTRGPVLHFPSAIRAAEALKWIQNERNFQILKSEFDSTSRFARLQRLHPRVAGRYLFIRFVAYTGDAMGMNMLSKGTEVALHKLHHYFPDVEMCCLSGNFCTDKKPSAVNWIEGRGKSVVCEAIIPNKVVKDVLKTSVDALGELNVSKNLIGSAMAGSIGGFNAQAANIVAAIYIATGQDPAQTVGSSNCITIIEPTGHDREDLYISCTMPSIEIGTIGGGTVLPAQGACLDLLGVKGASTETPGKNSSELASVVCATVLAGELSLLSALAAGHLVRSHMVHNRSTICINASPQITVPLKTPTQSVNSEPTFSQKQ